LDLSPILPLEVTAADGRNRTIYWRKPEGKGPFPAILFIHGGLDEYPAESLRAHLTENPIVTRFLAAGHAVVMATFRTYSQEIQSRGPILDCSAALDGMVLLPAIDPDRMFVYGGSGGGSIAIELASEENVRGVIACEPATVIYTGMLNTADYGTRLEMMREPDRFFTKEVGDHTLAKLKTIRAPVLIIHSDRHDLVKLNKPMFLPLMREAGVKVDYREYPGYGHGFYWGGGGDRWGKAADPAVVEAVFADVLEVITQAE
jgi:acetyl esterase/lipase